MLYRSNITAIQAAAGVFLLLACVGCTTTSQSASIEGPRPKRIGPAAQTPRFSVQQRDSVQSASTHSRMQTLEEQIPQDRTVEQHSSYTLEYDRKNASSDEDYAKLMESIRQEMPNALNFIETRYGQLGQTVKIEVLASMEHIPTIRKGSVLARAAAYDAAVTNGVIYLSAVKMMHSETGMDAKNIHGLLVHELAHVVQHRRIGDPNTIIAGMRRGSGSREVRSYLIATEAVAFSVQYEALKGRAYLGYLFGVDVVRLQIRYPGLEGSSEKLRQALAGIPRSRTGAAELAYLTDLADTSRGNPAVSIPLSGAIPALSQPYAGAWGGNPGNRKLRSRQYSPNLSKQDYP